MLHNKIKTPDPKEDQPSCKKKKKSTFSAKKEISPVENNNNDKTGLKVDLRPLH